MKIVLCFDGVFTSECVELFVVLRVLDGGEEKIVIGEAGDRLLMQPLDVLIERGVGDALGGVQSVQLLLR